MKPSTAIFVCLMLAPVMSASAQVQVGPQYRGFYTGGVSSHTGGIAAEAHFPQENWAWGIELEATTGSDFRHWTTAMLNAGLVVNDSYFYGSWGAGRFKARNYDVSDSGTLYGIGINMPLGRDFRADFSVDRLASDVYSSTTSFRYEFPTTAEKRRRQYSSGVQQSARRTENAPASTPAVQELVLDPPGTETTDPAVEVVVYSPEEEVVVTAPAPVHPMKIAIQEGCNVVSVKVIDESEVWDLFCPSTLKRITVSI